MIDQTSERHPLELLAEEFTERLRRGESPSVDAYATSHPELADEIHDLFPTIAEMEQLKRRKEQAGERLGFPEGLRIERLGDYRISHEIGRGGMGIVYEAEQESLGRRVAIKVLPRHLLPDSKQYQRFDREARTAARLHHTNIVPVFGVGEQDGFRYYVMQYIDGVGLDEVVRELERAGKGAPAAGEAGGEERGPREARRAEEAAGIARALLSGRWSEAGDPLEAKGPGPSAGNGAPSGGADGAAVRTPVRGAPSPSTETKLIPPASLAAAVNKPRPAHEDPASPERLAFRLGSGFWRCVAGIGLQAASGLQYAHAQGTLHRDIKPANLLLDSQGFVWVGDFGLAKTMDDHAISQTGDVVGTLRYMAPEQLSGEADERSDVYGLGLSLYELAALRPAYREPDTKRLIRAITDGQVMRLRRIRPEIPRDLETIILKAIAREPAHRYRSAGDLRADLQRFLDDIPIRARRIGAAGRLWRWSKRNRALATVGGTALALLVLLAVVATVGYVETRKAWDGESQSSKYAWGALDEIFDQFAPNRSAPASSLTLGEGESESENIEVAIPPVLSRPAAALLENLLKYYERLADLKGEDAGLRRKIAEANRRVGDIRQRLGNSEEARAAYQRALDVYQVLEERSPDNGALRIEVAKIHNELGSMARDLQESGRPSHEKALAILGAMPSATSASPEFRFELARTRYFLSRSGWPGAGPGGIAPELLKATDRRKGERPADPENPPERRDEKRGPFGRRGQQDWERIQKEQKEHLEGAIAILDGLLVEDPRAPEYRLLLALVYRGLGLGGLGKSQDTAALEKAREILEKLVADFPNIPDYRYNLAKMYADMAGTLSPREESAKSAVDSLGKALAISEDLVADHPHVPIYAVSLVQFHQKIATFLQRSRQFNAAEVNLEKALEVQSMLDRRYPEIASYKSLRVLVLDSLARLLRDQHRGEEAWVYLQEAISILEAILADGPQTFQQGWARDSLARQLRTLSEVLFDLGDESGAAEAWEKSQELGQRSGWPGGRGGQSQSGPGPNDRR